MQLSRAELIAVERELCRRSLAQFARRAWHVLEPGKPLKWGWALDAICEHLEAVSKGEITRLLINVPPGSMKSLLTSVIWPAWEWGPRDKQELRIIGTAHEEQLAIRDSRKCRDLIKSEWYQALWPVRLARDLDGKREFGNTRKGVRQARAFTSMTGVRGDRVILDDPISADGANSPAELESVRTTFTETLPTRVNDDKSAIVVIMQRLNEKDTSGVILEMGLPYVHLCIPMRFEVGYCCSTSIGWRDPRTQDGELMFPERFNEKEVQQLELILGPYGTAGQLQQRPSPRGGGIIKGEWFKRWKELPLLRYRGIFADTAQKTKEHNDYTVFQCWGAGAEGNAYLIDQIRGKWEAPELKRRAVDFWEKHKADTRQGMGQLRSMCVEDKSSGTGLIQDLRLTSSIPILPIQRNTDKLTRCMDVVAYIEAGKVYIPADAPWVSDYVGEAESFGPGKRAGHDDQLDPTFDAINDMVASSNKMAVWQRLGK